ncbi:uncharacterized protein LOC111623245 [Centruroides sculpturatus]|uniref:uncharacterized protein LOC111623245 n=1 Tax=Centruroides sculpturatus TaxID=218467 RepID=UPI000C6ED2BA|nr:uncharacterized protein LOC111623245 [Centruroides sculpturatus]
MFCKEWNMQELIGVVIESGKQLLTLNDYKALDEFWHTLYFLLQQENINFNLEENFNPIYEVFSHYILKHKENENLLPHSDSFTAVAAAISIFIILYSSKIDERHSLNADHCLRYIKKMFEIVKKIVIKKETMEEHDSINKKMISESVLNDYSIDITEDLRHLYILHDSLNDLCNLMNSST